MKNLESNGTSLVRGLPLSQVQSANDIINDIYRHLKYLRALVDAINDDVDPPGGAPFAHEMLSVTHSDTTPASAVDGDIFIRSGSKWIRLAIGSADQLLTVSAGLLPEWRDPGEWSVLTNGDPDNPEPIYDSNGDIMMGYTP